MNTERRAALPPESSAGFVLPVYFSEAMVADAGSFSPSAGKPALVVAAWQRAALPVRVVAPVAATPEELARAHAPGYVRDVLACRVPNGFGNTSPAVARSLPYTSGAMLSAARAVLAGDGNRVACAPCSGFHHAGYAAGGGFCTFNGLMVTACALRAEGRARRVAILDCDQHYGDGTDDVIAELDAAAWVRHFTAGGEYTAAHQAEAFLARLPGLVASFADCDVMLYQAGADPHVHDPLGGWLTTAQLRRRDELVFAAARAVGLPVVWNLAGGYQRAPDGGIPAVLEIHENTARACIAAYSAGAA